MAGTPSRPASYRPPAQGLAPAVGTRVALQGGLTGRVTAHGLGGLVCRVRLDGLPPHTGTIELPGAHLLPLVDQAAPPQPQPAAPTPASAEAEPARSPPRPAYPQAEPLPRVERRVAAARGGRTPPVRIVHRASPTPPSQIAALMAQLARLGAREDDGGGADRPH